MPIFHFGAHIYVLINMSAHATLHIEPSCLLLPSRKQLIPLPISKVLGLFIYLATPMVGGSPGPGIEPTATAAICATAEPTLDSQPAEPENRNLRPVFESLLCSIDLYVYSFSNTTFYQCPYSIFCSSNTYLHLLFIFIVFLAIFESLFSI